MSRRISSSGSLTSPKKEPNISAVSTNDYLDSLTKRLEHLERKVLGKRLLKDQPPLFQTVNVRQIDIFLLTVYIFLFYRTSIKALTIVWQADKIKTFIAFGIKWTS